MSVDNTPIFPIFKSIEFSDRNVFENYSLKFDPFADYTFNNYYSWDVKGNNALSTLNGNLVLKFTDYVTGKPFLSFIGTNKVNDTISQLLTLAKKENLDHKLKLIPEINILALKRTDDFVVQEDLTSSDYIFSISEIAKMEGRHYKNKRQAANKCEKSYNIKFVDGSNKIEAFQEANNLLIKWNEMKLKHNNDVDFNHEQIAIEKMFKVSVLQENVLLTLAYSNNKIVGFSLDELLQDGFVLSHYFKTLPNYYGLTELLNRHVAQRLELLGYKNWNWQQDLGIENLRKMKIGYRPKKFMRKYIIEKA